VEWGLVLNAAWKLMARRISEVARWCAKRIWKSTLMDSVAQRSFDIAVIGAGPAGIAAAVAAAESGARVALVDDNLAPGGQIWRGGASASHHPEAAHWLNLLSNSGVTRIAGTRVFYARNGALDAESDHALSQILYEKLILATGARELFLPFPGWTLPNVFGAGGLQALVKSGLPVNGKRVVIAGTGPLLLAVAAYLSERGADVLCICEQTPFSQLRAFTLAMTAFPRKLVEAAQLRFRSRRAPYLTSTWPVAAFGQDRVKAVQISDNHRLREIECDYLACGFHLVPNLELARALECRVTDGCVEVNELQETSQPGIYCAGEPTGVGGMELSIVEGQIAGYAAAGRINSGKQFLATRARYRRIVSAMKKAFALRPELATLAKPDTFLCRCEDVSFADARKHASWRAAKLHSRCGMGPCQGRICGSAAEFLFGWTMDSSRPPIFPVRCSSLAAVSSPVNPAQPGGGSQ
jgi:NADPH-dependent 2,4-dienoyl-CoA reductase/sulfur reductase-like enzyme